MDLQMPRMDGYQATARIRERFASTQLPIVAMTAHGRDEDREQCLAAGMNAHLAKPIDPTALAELLARWLPTPVPSRPTGTEAAPTDLPIQLPGVNVAAGLALAGNRTSLYQQLLRDFAQDHADSVTRLRAAVRAGDRPEAARIAHNLKGTAANLGARTLERSLQAFERAQREGEPLGDTLSRVEQALAELLDAIGRLPAPPAVERNAGDVAPDARAIQTLLDELGRALSDGNFDATQRFERLAEALGGPAEPALAELSRAVHAFDFDAARGALEALRCSLTPVPGETRDG
jgi:CheY-like chemotaxis protein